MIKYLFFGQCNTMSRKKKISLMAKVDICFHVRLVLSSLKQSSDITEFPPAGVKQTSKRGQTVTFHKRLCFWKRQVLQLNLFVLGTQEAWLITPHIWDSVMNTNGSTATSSRTQSLGHKQLEQHTLTNSLRSVTSKIGAVWLCTDGDNSLTCFWGYCKVSN